MRTRLFAAPLIIAALRVSLFAASAEPVASAELRHAETFALLLKVKSADTAERSAAVAKLIGLREAVSESLKQTVADANAGKLSADAKSSALFLMGRLGLWQCADILEAEKDWRWSFPGEPVRGRGERDMMEKGRTPGANALAAAAFGDHVTVRPARAAAELSAYPVLAAALEKIRVEDGDALYKAENTVLEWYSLVSDGLASVIEKRDEPLYSQEVLITAVWLLGEYRVPRTAMGVMADTDDTGGVTAGYPAALDVTGLATSRCAATALVKCGRRVKASAYVYLLRSADVTQDAREALARALVLIDAKAASEVYDKYLANTAASSRDPGRLERVKSVEGIMKAGAAAH